MFLETQLGAETCIIYRSTVCYGSEILTRYDDSLFHRSLSLFDFHINAMHY